MACRALVSKTVVLSAIHHVDSETRAAAALGLPDNNSKRTSLSAGSRGQTSPAPMTLSS